MKLDEVGSAAAVNAITSLVFKPPAAMLGSFTIRLPPVLAGAHCPVKHTQVWLQLQGKKKPKPKRL